MTASLEVVVNNSRMHSSKALDLDHDDPLSKEDVDISSSSSDPPDSSNTEWNQITKLGMHDVLLGRGGGTNNHEGNILFRQLVNEHKMRYLACSKVDKPKVAREVVQLWRKMDPPGRFLARKDETKRGPGSVKDVDNVWFEVGDKKAREKASQCLRERTAEVIPYMKQLRQNQDAATEHGVSMVPQQLEMHNQNNQVQQPDNSQVQQPDNNHSMNNAYSMNNSNHGMSHHNMNPYSHPPGVAAAPAPAFPRRNSKPGPPDSAQFGGGDPPPYMGRRGSLPAASQGATSPYSSRRASLGVTSHSAGGEFYAQAAPPLGGGGGGGGDEFYGDMSDSEYEQMIMMQRQQLQLQHMQIQRMRQQRLRTGDVGARRPSAGGGVPSSMGGAPPPMAPGYDMTPPSGNGNHIHASGYQQQQQQQQQQMNPQQQQQQQQLSLLYPNQRYQQQQHQHGHFSQQQEPLSQQDPLLYMANQTKSPLQPSRKPSIGASALAPASPRATKRSVDESDYQIGVATPSPASLSGRGRGRNSDEAPPDMAPSSAAAFPAAATTNAHDDDCAPQDGELTLEEYRQQLEAYMSNNQVPNQSVDHPDDDDHLDSPSDLEDDWEKERDRAFKKEKKRGVGRTASGVSRMSRTDNKEKKRGVGRNVSGVSYMSTKTDTSAMGMSLVSGMSMFSSDLMSMGTTTKTRERVASVGSNLSLMSELTDLSQNIDDLHLFDE